VLAGGIVLAGIIGLLDGSYNAMGLIQAIGDGVAGMQELSLLSILISGLVEVIKYNGGIDYLLQLVTRNVKSNKGAQFGIAGLVSLTNLSTANNTISILIAGPLSKNIADQYDIDPRKSASLLDIFSCCIQGLIPYGAQMLLAAGVASISPLSILQYSFYPFLIGVCGLLAIVIDYPKFKTSKEVKADIEVNKAV
jgi:Na+/H+ antiporter NhaC